HLIFSPTEEVSGSLQRIDNCLQDVLCAIKTLTRYLERIKCVQYFKTFYELVLKEAEPLTQEPKLPRVRRPPKRFADTLQASVVHQISTTYLRFQQSVFPLLCKVEKFILAAANGTKEEADDLNIENIIEFLTDNINISHLQREMNMLTDYLLIINLENNFGIRKISKIQTICDLLNVQSVGKAMFCEFSTLIRLYLTIPVTTATAERSFSVMNRIKTYLRSSMTQQRLNHVIIPHIHTEKLDKLDLNNICSDFILKTTVEKLFLVVNSVV
ncbi:unnamed protein product, partial [Didymodactylos carnosus]